MYAEGRKFSKFFKKLTSPHSHSRKQAQNIVGDKGNQAILGNEGLSISLAKARAKIHLKFVYCNLSQESMLDLANSLAQNTSLMGFTLMHNDFNFKPGSNEFDPESDRSIHNALLSSRAKIHEWNGRPFFKHTPSVVAVPIPLSSSVPINLLEIQAKIKARESVKKTQEKETVDSFSAGVETIKELKAENDRLRKLVERLRLQSRNNLCCCVCMDAGEANRFFYPCGHRCCEFCGNALNFFYKECPECRSNIHSVRKAND